MVNVIAPIISIGEILNDLEELKSENSSDLKDLKEKPKSKRGGVRPGAGIPKGTKLDKTIKKEHAEAYIRDRVIKGLAKLVNAQLSLADGLQMLYKIDTIEKKGRNGQIYIEKSKPILVTNQTEIENYLAGDYDKVKEYYFLTTKQPDNKAITDLFDRVFGRAKQAIDLSGSLTLEEVFKKNWEARHIKVEKMSDDEFIPDN